MGMHQCELGMMDQGLEAAQHMEALVAEPSMVRAAGALYGRLG